MKAARMLKTQSGFSLIELMIVVAIIGILASIAVPNFKKFQVKARQSEAKSQLTSLYTAEKAFYGEWTGYTGDFRDIGYQPEGKMRYHVGFATVGNIPAAPFAQSSNGAAQGTLFNTVVAAPGGTGLALAGFTHSYDAAKLGAAFPGHAAAGNCARGGLDPSQTQFAATAASTIAELGSDRIDQWTITEAKAICNNQAGI